MMCVGAMSLAILSKIRILLPWIPVPITLQTAGVYCLGLTTTPMHALGTLAIYLVCGMFVPVFASSSCGLCALFGPTAGYLYGFLVAAWWIARMKNKVSRQASLFAVLMLSAMGILLLGGVWLVVYSKVLGYTCCIAMITSTSLLLALVETAKIALIVEGYRLFRGLRR